MPATLKSETPTAATSSFIRELGSESGLTPLHMAAYSGKENIVRLLMNSPGVQVDATTNLNVSDRVTGWGWEQGVRLSVK